MCLKKLEIIFKGVGPSAVKTGMLGTEYAVNLAAQYIKEYKIENYVLDPVMVCKGSKEALQPELNQAVIKKLLPLAKIITPNLFEAEQISGLDNISSLEDMKTAAKLIFEKGAKNIFIKGGAKLKDENSKSKATDLFFDGENFSLIESPLIETKWTHGAGCTTAAAITSGLALNLSPYEAVCLAKKFISCSLSSSFPLNQWVGPGNPSAWRNEKLFR